jgi:hypothetical protein
MEEDYITSLEDELMQLEQELVNESNIESGMSFMPMLDKVSIIHTPLGMYPIDSMFKPSSRWDCWIGNTNFDITKTVKKTLIKTEGVEALRILGRYTFFIGIPVTFSIRDVRQSIEQQLCDYTEQEILDEETQITVDLVKDQIQTKKYWTILVTPTGKVDYIVSNSLDKKYLDGLNELFELKKLLGGIILRGDDG